MDRKKPGPSASQLFKRVVLSMADVDQGKRPWVAVSVIASWMALTLLHDVCALQYMHTAEHLVGPNHHVILPLALTLAEVVMCMATLKFGNQYGSYLESIGLVVCSHLFSVFAKNIWLQAHEPEFGIFGSFVEPLMCLVLIYICNGTCPSGLKLLGISLITVGLTFTSVTVHTLLNTSRTVVITVIYGVFSNLRNICVTYWHDESITIVPRSLKALAVIVLSPLLIAIALTPYLTFEWIISLPLALITCCLHVGVTYVACAQLLAKISIPTLCILGGFVQFLEGQVLITPSHRATLAVATLSCIIILVGLYLYTHDAVETGHAFHVHKDVSSNEMFTRVQFLLFLTSTLGVLFYVLQPRVSQRDLHTLSYVGLDKVIRRLLSLELPEGHEH